MWSKGAVVIIKHGDKDMADSMEASLVPVKQSKDKPMPRRSSEYWSRELAIADFMYNKSYHDPPEWAGPIIGFIALIVYGISITIEKISKIIFYCGGFRHEK